MVQESAPDMARIQVFQGNCGHWEIEVQCPILPREAETSEQSSLPRNFGLTSRRLRLRSTSGRDISVEFTSEDRSRGVHETLSMLQRPREGELGSDLRVPDTSGGAPTVQVSTDEILSCSPESNGSAVVAGSDVLLRPNTTGRMSVTERPMRPSEAHEDQILQLSSTHDLVHEARQDDSSSLSNITLATGSDVQHQNLRTYNAGKENWDPRGEWYGAGGLHRSPLPEWFPRKPLQDITNVLASGLVEELTEPKKKRNKKTGSALQPSLFAASETLTKRDAVGLQPKVSSCPSSKRTSTLMKNFR